MDSSHSTPKYQADAASASASRPALWLLGGLLVFCFLCAFFQVCDVDVGYHIRTGEHIMAGHGVPTRNTFSYTVPDEPWPATQWMPATIYSWVHRLGGVPALTTFKALLATLMMFLVWCGARDAGGKNSWWPLWVATVVVLIVRVRFFERPDLFTSTLFALTVLLDQRFNTNRRWQWIFLPLLMALWANTHAGYIYGFVLLGALAGAEWLEFIFPKLRGGAEGAATRPAFQTLLVRPLGMVFSALAAVIAIQLINPNGWRVLTVPFTQFLSKFWQSVIMEYLPPTLAGSPLFYVWLAVLVILQALTWRQFRARYFLPAVALGYFACSSQRSISAFAIVSASYAAYMLSKLPRLNVAELPRLSRPLLPVAWAALVALVIVPNRTFVFGTGLFHGYYPVEIFQFVEKEVPPQNLFNDMRFGGPMLWKLYPNFKPFIDGRGDAYTEEFWKTTYLPAVEGREEWEQIFEKYHVTGALLSIEEPTKVLRLATKLFAHPDWALVAYNDETLLFLKRTEANRPIIRSHAFTQLWPGNWNLGTITTGNTNWPTFVSEATRAWEMYPGLYAHAVTARCAMSAGDYAGAADQFAYLVHNAQAGDAFWSDYAFCLYQSKRPAEAERALGKMIDKKIAVGFAYYLKHFIALDQKRPADAKAFLAKALETEPQNAEYRRALQRLQPGAALTDNRRHT